LQKNNSRETCTKLIFFEQGKVPKDLELQIKQRWVTNYKVVQKEKGNSTRTNNFTERTLKQDEEKQSNPHGPSPPRQDAIDTTAAGAAAGD
jgi:hypothetical protein